MHVSEDVVFQVYVSIITKAVLFWVVIQIMLHTTWYVWITLYFNQHTASKTVALGQWNDIKERRDSIVWFIFEV